MAGLSRFNRKRTYIILAAGAVLVLLGIHFAAQGIFVRYLEALAGFASTHQILGAVLFFVLAGVSVLLGPFSSTPLVPVAVSVWGVPFTFALLLSGWVAGDMMVYWIGRGAGYRIVVRMVGKTKLEQWIKFLEDNLTFYLLLLFRLAAPSETGYAFGILKYPFRRYLVISLLAELPFVVLAVFAGGALLDSGWVSLALLGALWIVLILASAELLRRKSKKRRAASAARGEEQGDND